MGKSSGGIRGNGKGKDVITNRKDFIEFLKSTEQTLYEEKSFKWGSEYYTLGGFSFRISNHTKPDGTFGSKNYGPENDFRSYQEAYEKLKSMGFKNLKKEKEIFFKKNRKKLKEVKIGYETVYQNGLGYKFVDANSALNSWFLILNEKKRN